MVEESASKESGTETSIHTKTTGHHIPENGILHSHPCENLKSYKGKVIPIQAVEAFRVARG
jgi:hypothetical protein